MTIEQIHCEDLKILKEFLAICNRHNLGYFIIGGTLLGAIRHQGFIPWDDDMDIAMMRPDFERFVEIANEELPNNMKLLTFRNTENYRYYLPHLVNLDIELVEKRNEKTQKKINLFIDIFPIDGTPNSLVMRRLHYLRIMINRLLYSWYYIDEIDTQRKRRLYEKLLIILGRILPTKKINPRERLERIDCLLKRYSPENSNNVGTIMGAYRTREIVPAEMFGTPQKYRFESYELYGPELYDEYLTHIYGDYMTPQKTASDTQHLVTDDK